MAANPYFYFVMHWEFIIVLYIRSRLGPRLRPEHDPRVGGDGGGHRVVLEGHAGSSTSQLCDESAWRTRGSSYVTQDLGSR